MFTTLRGRMNRLGIIVTGFQKWAELTKPCLDSVHRFCQRVPLVVVDNGSNPPYPIDCLRSDNSSLSKAANMAINALPECAFYLWLANDTRVTAPLDPYLDTMNQKSYYGARRVKDDIGTWLDGGWTIIPRRVWQEVGEYDERFLDYGFEDADYCYRVRLAGFRLIDMWLPIKHIGKGSLDLRPDYPQIYERNRRLFLSKHGQERLIIND